MLPFPVQSHAVLSSCNFFELLFCLLNPILAYWPHVCTTLSLVCKKYPSHVNQFWKWSVMPWLLVPYLTSVKDCLLSKVLWSWSRPKDRIFCRSQVNNYTDYIVKLKRRPFVSSSCQIIIKMVIEWICLAVLASISDPDPGPYKSMKVLNHHKINLLF